MKLIMLSILGGAVCALALVIPSAAADKPPVTTTATQSTSLGGAWPSEDLSGALSVVDRKEDLVVVKVPNGVPFDMMITPRTNIWSGGRKISLEDLEQYRNRQVSVRFVAERRGDVAESIRITG